MQFRNMIDFHRGSHPSQLWQMLDAPLSSPQNHTAFARSRRESTITGPPLERAKALLGVLSFGVFSRSCKAVNIDLHLESS